MRREAALRLGGFSDEKWGPIADYEFWYRLSCAGRVEVVRAVGAFYRVGPTQWTERVWGRMLRLTHLLRLRIAREHLGQAAPRAVDGPFLHDTQRALLRRALRRWSRGREALHWHAPHGPRGRAGRLGVAGAKVCFRDQRPASPTPRRCRENPTDSAGQRKT